MARPGLSVGIVGRARGERDVHRDHRDRVLFREPGLDAGRALHGLDRDRFGGGGNGDADEKRKKDGTNLHGRCLMAAAACGR